MWGQLLRAGAFLSAFAVVAVPAWNLWHATDGYDWYAAAIVTTAEAKLVLGYEADARQDVRMRDGSYRVLTITEIAASRPARRARERLRDEVLASALLGAKASLVVIALFLVLFWFRGWQLNRARRIRGAELATARELGRRVRPVRARLGDVLALRPGPYRIAGVPFPARTETQHTIVSGTTGSGKTVLISDLVAQIRERGERCVIYDKMGSYTAAFFDADRDVLLNPLDARSPRWSPFYEARGPRDFDMMAAALIPQQRDTVDPFWVTAARQLFSNGAGVLRQKGETRNTVLVDHLLKTELTALAQAMEGTVAQSIVDPENPKTALSVRAMLTANLSALEFLPDEGEPFSIREWISDEDRGGFLFLTSRGDQHASLRGLISTWLEIAVNAMLSLDQSDGRRIWVILDELPTLHQVPSLQPGLAESRQFGGCFVLGVQVISALRDLYGRNGAETVSGLCGTRVVLAAPDRDTAQWSADSLGRAEVEEVAEGFSYGANTIRDGVSLTPKRELRPLALASEIMRLENLHGYLRFPGPLPVATIRLDYVKRRRAAERFVPREAEPEADAAPDEGPEGPATDDAPGSEAVRPEAGASEPPAWLEQAGAGETQGELGLDAGATGREPSEPPRMVGDAGDAGDAERVAPPDNPSEETDRSTAPPASPDAAAPPDPAAGDVAAGADPAVAVDAQASAAVGRERGEAPEGGVREGRPGSAAGVEI